MFPVLGTWLEQASAEPGWRVLSACSRGGAALVAEVGSQFGSNYEGPMGGGIDTRCSQGSSGQLDAPNRDRGWGSIRRALGPSGTDLAELEGL